MAEAKISQPIKGSGKKGGTVFPRISLADAVPLAKKLVSKTHVAPQHADIILPGVFGSSGPRGQVKASALKQYRLLDGKSDAYVASELAKRINSAPTDELYILYAEACLAPKVFGLLYKTFHGDTVSIAKLKQQAAAAGVHPDFHDECVNLFSKSIEFAQLGKIIGETVQLAPLVEGTPSRSGEAVGEENNHDGELSDGDETPPLDDKEDNLRDERDRGRVIDTPARAIINVSVTLDSSLDTEKLERQLALLRKYGAL